MHPEKILSEKALQEILDRDFPKGKRWGMFAFKLGWRKAFQGYGRHECPFDWDWEEYLGYIARKYQELWIKGYDASKEQMNGRMEYYRQQSINWLKRNLTLGQFGIIHTAITEGYKPDWKEPVNTNAAKAKAHIEAKITELESVR